VERALFFLRPGTRLAYSLVVEKLKAETILIAVKNRSEIKQEVLRDKMSPNSQR
jgi:hypothetical protein